MQHADCASENTSLVIVLDNCSGYRLCFLSFSMLFLIFKLEEVKPALLLHLPKLFAETAVFGSASGLGCWLVVGIAQAVI
jgi:hypothetical protein